jgi:hypothetical protein
MPRSGASALRFDAGWDWTDSKSRSEQQRDLAYYDWSLDDDFAGARPRLRAVPDAEVRERPRRRRAAVVERPEPRAVVADRPRARQAVAADRPRPRVAATEPAPRLAPAPVAPAELFESAPLDAESIIDAIEAPVIDPQTGRRTITITGRGAERGSISRRPAVLPTERVRHKPDRIAMWAVLLCVLMILAAATSAHAAILH